MKLVETVPRIREHLVKMDKTQSKDITIRGNSNVLTINGEVSGRTFTSIVGKEISVHGLGNIVSGEDIMVKGDRSFILGMNIDF